jgi:hypothetical protein
MARVPRAPLKLRTHLTGSLARQGINMLALLP